MANAQRTEVFDVSIDKIFKVLTNFEGYSDFMDGVSGVSVLETNGNVVKAQYDLNIIKKFSYIMNHTIEEPNKISWSFVSGDLFKKSDGAWTLKDLGDGTTEVTYSVDIDFKVMVPGMVSKKLVASNLPSMLKSVKNKAKEL